MDFNPVQHARPPWWRATIWIDVLLFGPFYACAIYAYVNGRDWIRNPSLIWSDLMFANVPWLLMPLAVAARMWGDQPFRGEVTARE